MTVAVVASVDASTNLFVDLLEEGDLLLQTLNAPLQVQPGQSSIVNILDTQTHTHTINIEMIINRKCQKLLQDQDIER